MIFLKYTCSKKSNLLNALIGHLLDEFLEFIELPFL